MADAASTSSPLQPEVALLRQRVAELEAALALASQVVSARRDPGRMLACLSRIVTVAPIFVGERGDATDVADLILAMCRSPHGGPGAK